ncbi:hypothetical protein V3C99_004851, partial [Haemonchus contortus]
TSCIVMISMLNTIALKSSSFLWMGLVLFSLAACSRKRYGVPENTISVRSLYDDDLPPPPSLAPQSLNK